VTLVSDGTGLDRGAGAPRRDLAVWTEQHQNRCTLRLSGRLCSDTVASFDAHVDRLGCRWCEEVVVDIRGLSVLDLVGARVLVGLSHYVAGRAGRFQIEGASRFMQSMLDTAGIELD
jgi:anti-anti-sigma factor